jgi:DNA-binding response OmpR family regulator
MATILLIDDARASREALAKILRLDGYSVICAGDGIEGLDAVAHTRPDLILLDLMMPRMDGLGFLKELRAQEQHEHLPVMILTAAGEPDTLATAARLGVRTILTKSRFTIPELLAQVRAHLIPIDSLGLRGEPGPHVTNVQQ